MTAPRDNLIGAAPGLYQDVTGDLWSVHVDGTEELLTGGVREGVHRRAWDRVSEVYKSTDMHGGYTLVKVCPVEASQITPREAAGLLRAVERKWNIMDQPWRRATIDKLRAIAERDKE